MGDLAKQLSQPTKLSELLQQDVEEPTTEVPNISTPQPGPGSSPSRRRSIWDRAFEHIGSAALIDANARDQVGKLEVEVAGKIIKKYAQIENAVLTGIKYDMRGTRAISSGKAFADKDVKRSLDNLINQPQEFSTFFDGVRDGWEFKDETSFRDLKNEYLIGEEYNKALDEFMSRTKGRRIYWAVDELMFDIAADLVIDGGLVLAFKPVRVAAKHGVARGIYKFAPDLYNRKFLEPLKISEAAVRKGPTFYINEAVETIYAGPIDEAINMRLILDDEFRQIVKESGDILELVRDPLALDKITGETAERAQAIIKEGKGLRPKGTIIDIDSSKVKAFAATADQPVTTKVSKKVARERNAINKLNESVALADNTVQLQRQQITELYSIADNMPEGDTYLYGELIDKSEIGLAIEARQDELAKAVAKKELLTNQIAESRSRISNAIDGFKYNPLIDYAQTSRALREGYMDRFMSVNIPGLSQIQKTNAIDDIVRATTMGRKHGDKFFDHTVLDKLTDEEFLTMFSYMDYVATNPEQFTSGAFKGIYSENLFARGTAHLTKFGFDWLSPADRWYDINNAKQIINEARHADVITMQDGIKALEGWDEILARNFGSAKKAKKNTQIQQAIWREADGQFDFATNLLDHKRITAKQYDGIKEAATYVNDVFDEIADKFEVANRWKAGLRRERFYIRNTPIRAVDEAAGDSILLSRLAESFDKVTSTKIDISEFKNRLVHNDPLLEHADAAFTSGLQHELYKLHWEPALAEMKGLAKVTGNKNIINYTDDFIKYAIRGEVTPFERFYEPAFKGVAFIMEGSAKLIPGINFQAEERAARQLLSMFRRGTYHGALWGRPKPALRNLTQGLMNIPLSDYGSYRNGLQSLFMDSGQTLANKHCSLLVGRVPLEAFDIRTMKGFGEIGHKAFKWADRVPNIKGGFNGYVMHLTKNSDSRLKILRKFGLEDINSLDQYYIAADRAFDAGQLLAVKEAANLLTRISQHSYRPISMSKWMTSFGPAGRAAGQFSTWPSNYFFSYLPELMKYSITGKNILGETASFGERMALMKHAVNGAALYVAGRTAGIDMRQQTFFGPTPTRLGPYAELSFGMAEAAFGIGKGLSGYGTKNISSGVDRMDRSLTFMQLRPIPHPSPLIFREAADVLSEKKNIKDLFYIPTKD